MIENKIAITLEVDKNMFESCMMREITENLSEIPKEKIQGVILECIRDYFTANNFENLEKLLVESDSYNYHRKQPTKFLREIMNNNINDLAGKFQPIIDDAAEFMKENYSALIASSLTNIMLSSFFKQPSLSDSIEHGMREHMMSMINEFGIKTKFNEN